MDRARLKTFVILLLLVVNVAFWGIIIADRVESARLRTEARQELVQVLAELGIQADERDIPDSREQPVYRIARDLQAEGELVSAVLGAAEPADEGGGIYRYETENGTAQVHSSQFHISPQGEGFRTEGELEDTGQLMLGKLEITGRLVEREGDNGSGELTYMVTADGAPVVNAQVSFTFSGGYLSDISGTALTGNRQSYGAGDQMDEITALVLLAAHLDETDSRATAFTGVEMGYYMVEGTGYCDLWPVWYVETDAGTYTVDRQTGEIR